jgi:hypothetical protein
MAFSTIYVVSTPFANFSKAFRPTTIMLVVVVAGIAGILAYAPARAFMTTYFNGQVVQALLQKREKAGTGWGAHFTLMLALLRNLYPHLLAMASLYGLSYGLKWKILHEKSISGNILFTALVAASGIIPMLVSIKQYPHYLLPALPFVALLVALLLVQRISFVLSAHKQLTIFALSIGISLCWGATARKLAAIKPDTYASNAKQLRTLVPSAATIGVCHDLFQRADIHANFQRYHHLSVTMQTGSARYVLADSACLPQFDLKRDSLVTLNGGYFLIIKNAAPDRR